MASDPLTMLEAWFVEQCDGDWEHRFGVTIETLDNPGWRVQIDLAGTALEGSEYPPVESERSQDDWMRCWLSGTTFQAAGGAKNLGDILAAFARFANPS